MDKTEVIDLVKKYAEVVKNNFPVSMIVLYGSYVKGNIHKYSDIDVAVVVDSIDDDILESNAKLFRLRRDIDCRIEPILIEKNNNPSGFLEEILKTGEIIYRN